MQSDKIYEPFFYFLANHSESIISSQNIVLFYVVEGNFVLSINDKSYTLVKDDIVIVNTYDSYNIKGNNISLLCKCVFPPAILSRTVNMDDITFNCNSSIQKDIYTEEIKKILGEIIYNYHNNEKRITFYQTGLLYVLLDSMIRYYKTHSVDSGNEEDRALKIKKYINLHFREQISLTSLADTIFFSKAYLSKYIKKSLGKNFLEYLNDIRLNHISNEIINSNESITKIALNNGFSNMVMFNRIFRRAYGMTPAAYRTKNIKKGRISGPDISLQDIHDHKDDIDGQKTGALNDKENTDISIAVDAGSFEPYCKFWNKSINIGSASELMHSDIQEHILILKKELHIQHIHLWDIFSRDLFINASSMDGVYNFQKIDSIFDCMRRVHTPPLWGVIKGMDPETNTLPKQPYPVRSAAGLVDFLLNNDIRPIIDFGEKPKIIRANTGKTVTVIEHEPIYKSVDSGKKIYEAFMAHILNRYGINEIKDWVFEIWYDDRSYRQAGEVKQRYADSYRYIYNIIKKYSPSSLVGGGGFDLDYKFYESVAVIKELKDLNLDYDFLSITITGDDLGLEQGYLAEKIQRYSYSRERILLFKSILKNLNITHQKLWVTEWNSTTSDRNFLNDSIWKAAHLVKTFTELIGEVDLLSYGMGTDISAEYFDSSAILVGSRGILSKDGIMKPAFYAFLFLDKIGENLIQSGRNYIITTNTKGEYCLLLFKTV